MRTRSWREIGSETPCVYSHMDFEANGIIRTLLCLIEGGSLSVITRPDCERWVTREIVSLELQEPLLLYLFMKWLFWIDTQVIYTKHESINRWSVSKCCFCAAGRSIVLNHTLFLPLLRASVSSL